MRISDYIVSYLRDLGVQHVFGLQGSGTAIQMFDSLGEAEGIDYVCTLHEQAAGMAADSYACITGNLGVCVTTCGPGATNLYTCVSGSFFNSNPVVYIIGQPQVPLMKKDEKLRFFGYHENDVISIFKPITKYVVQITNPKDARYEVEKAIYLALEGRPGPVVIALPDDITWLQIEPSELVGFEPPQYNSQVLDIELDQCISLMQKAVRPILILGKGVRCSNAISEVKELIDYLDWPVALTWGIRDLLPYEDKRNVGSFGIQGSRSGNFSVQNADFILAIGTRFDPSETGQPAKNFAREATIVTVDVDKQELKKYDEYGIPHSLQICSDAKCFIIELKKKLKNMPLNKSYSDWLNKVFYWKEKYPVFQMDYLKEDEVNPYVLIEALSNVLSNGDVVVTDTSTPRNYLFQAFKAKANQRLSTWWNFACLGYGLPAGIGACYAHTGNVVTLMGDGGLQFNIQELATVVFNSLNLKIIVLDNGGYANIYHVQNNFMKGRHYGIDKAHGLPLPDSAKIAKAYGLPVVTIMSNEEIEEKLSEVMSMEGPVFCIVYLPMKHWTVPRKVGKDPIEDMTPKLSREEFNEQMLVASLPEQI